MRPPLLVQPVGRAAVRITPARAKRRCAAPGNSLQFADLLLVFSRGKHGAPHSPNFEGGKSWHVPSSAFIPGQAGLCAAADISRVSLALCGSTSMVNLMFGPAAPLEVFPRCARMRMQKGPTPPAVLSVSANTWPPLENLYLTVSWSRKSLVSLPPSNTKALPLGTSTLRTMSLSAFSHNFDAWITIGVGDRAPSSWKWPDVTCLPSAEILRMTLATACPSHPNFVSVPLMAASLHPVTKSATLSAGISLGLSKYFLFKSGILKPSASRCTVGECTRQQLGPTMAGEGGPEGPSPLTPEQRCGHDSIAKAYRIYDI